MGKCKPLKFVYSNAASLSINPVCFETKVISSAICHLLVFFCGAGEVEKNSLIALPDKVDTVGSRLSKPCVLILLSFNQGLHNL